MAVSRTRTVKNKHAAPKTSEGKGGGSKSAGSISKSRKSTKSGGAPPSQQVFEKNRAALLKKPKKKTYTEEQLGIPKLNMITPVGVVKPRGKKKGKVFVDDSVRFHQLGAGPLKFCERAG
jgi:60S ribosomal subunit assembly/export protein LOC1